MSFFDLAGHAACKIIIISEGGSIPASWSVLAEEGCEHIGISAPQQSAGGRNRWAALLDRAVAQSGQPVILVAQGLGCMAASWWAKLSPSLYVAPVAGALLIDPRNPYAVADEDPFLGPDTLLPFPSVVAAQAAEAERLALGWGSRLAGGAVQGTGNWSQVEQALLDGLSRLQPVGGLRGENPATVNTALLSSLA